MQHLLAHMSSGLDEPHPHFPPLAAAAAAAATNNATPASSSRYAASSASAQRQPAWAYTRCVHSKAAVAAQEQASHQACGLVNTVSSPPAGAAAALRASNSSSSSAASGRQQAASARLRPLGLLRALRLWRLSCTGPADALVLPQLLASP